MSDKKTNLKKSERDVDLESSVDMVASAGFSYDEEENEALKKTTANEYNMNVYAQLEDKPAVSKDEVKEYREEVEKCEIKHSKN